MLQTKGNIDVLVGPFKTSLSATDTPVRWERSVRTFESCSQSEAKQQFITASEGEYVVLENPSASGNNYPVKGTRSNAVDLLMGYKIIIFPFAVQKVQKLNSQGGLSFESTVL